MQAAGAGGLQDVPAVLGEGEKMIGYTRLSMPNTFVICTLNGTILSNNGKKAKSPELYCKLAYEHDAQTAAQMIARSRKKKYVGYVK